MKNVKTRMSALRGRDFLPFLGSSGFQDGVADELSLEGVSKSGAGRFAFGDAVEEIGDLMNKTVLVTDLQAGHPPLAHVRMVAIGNMDSAPATEPAFVAVFEVLQPVEIMQIP